MTTNGTRPRLQSRSSRISPVRHHNMGGMALESEHAPFTYSKSPRWNDQHKKLGISMARQTALHGGGLSTAEVSPKPKTEIF